MALLIVGISGAAFSAGIMKSEPADPVYEENEKGLSYGYVNPDLPPDQQAYPQLIAAIGIDGTHGYVYANDLNGNMPKTPERPSSIWSALTRKQRVPELPEPGS